MKKNRFKILTVACVVGANLMFSSCVDNLLNQTPGGELASSLYWKTESDAPVSGSLRSPDIPSEPQVFRISIEYIITIEHGSCLAINTIDSIFRIAFRI